jgi:hypothetical protein
MVSVEMGDCSVLIPSAACLCFLLDCCLIAVRIVPGASEEWAAAPKPKAHKSMHHDYARQMAEMPEVPDYEYIMPVVAKKTEEQLSAAEVKVSLLLVRPTSGFCCQRLASGFC